MKKKWNWIDTTIIVIIILIIAFLSRDKIINTNDKVSTKNEKEIIITAETDKITKDMITDLKIGDQIFSQNTLQDASIEEINVEPLLDSAAGPDGKLKTYEDAQNFRVIVKINAKVVSNGPYMDLGGQEVKVGIPFMIKTEKVELSSKIKHIEVK
ncbi:DUF4330 domain-containing protein [Anaerosalibacter bizertensis]|uniref:DUF4330 domain-containing protein n=1 Tax=Anaerosalibacter bizertensis TaxID=932217 RepID=A0A9Q4AAF5_9FIRM|nr:DUF4330 family protein [Anaerosalibacter bizertensis]MBV1817559.1 DUF4330 domain-containing protein [Bacteroidales bacterium MSK.15.36]MCB5558755.1 DUF4330 domain-containing protein [Anaerosalibacter bizertensis]MCG4564087.1 DUF4330 domain-containing protein [Anaerosalibacter bizertensis]MCG4582330.1 DUF4330 domain-containing protein [Anaerosalibacter bizertensis]MCG4583955.1 DUF4330 domain-containing protein [Anaerosalibacter bizertensis]